MAESGDQGQKERVEYRYQGVIVSDVEKVINQLGCTRCGGCFAICPSGAVRMDYNSQSGFYDFRLIRDECMDCGRCVEVCPALWEGTDPSKNQYIGDFRSIFLAASADGSVRRNSSSGGFINSAVSFLLQKKACDQAIIVKSLHREPFGEVVSVSKPDFVMNNPREVSSRYVLMPTVSKMKGIEKGSRLLFVGTPCQSYAARRIAEKLDLDITIIGIACSAGTSANATKQLLKFYGIEEVKNLYYRGNGWPGEVQAEGFDKKGKLKKVVVPYPSSLFNRIYWSRVFINQACWNCKDHFAEFSDISTFDFWNPGEIKREKAGKSAVIVRTKRGEEITKRMADEACVNVFEELGPDAAIGSQPGPLRLKKERNRGLKGKNAYSRLLERFIRFHQRRISKKPSKPNKSKLMIKILSTIYLSLLSRARYEGGFRSDVLILHAHWSNRGDEAAVRAMVDSLRSELPDSKMKIMLMSKEPVYFSDIDVEVLRMYPLTFVDYIDTFLTLVTFGKISVTGRGRKFLQAVEDADFVIHAPGGPMIGDLYGGLLSDYSYLYRLIMPTIFKNKRLYFYAPSMGPFSGVFWNFLRKSALRKAEAIILREDLSARYLKEQLGFDSKVTIDSAFQNVIEDDYLERYEDISDLVAKIESPKEKVVGITATTLSWHPVYREMKGLSQRILDSIRTVIEHLIDRGYTPLLVPQLFGEQDDYSLLRGIQSLDTEKILLLPPHVDSYAQQALFSKLYCVISMRYHPSIFAAKGYTPFISISYEHKIEGFMERLGLKDLMINVKDISAQAIIDKFTYIENNYAKVKEQLRNEVPRLVDESRETTRIIVDKIKE
ncbi:MAG: 4Fe-4S dicluster domain-containing protein [Methanomassiliicoccales archaeon]|nr:MAG: 4Fe-4S dicluster domain-containing protein [Methanomassiliicoccales archaeon]